ncbi:MAG: translation initiation factor IF-3 [Thermodesulfovibrionia bacterium]
MEEALRLAEEEGLDLVEVAPNANPVVCRIMDYGKYRYQQSKKRSTKQRTIDVKEIKVRPQINEHDLLNKMRSIRRFLEDGDKAKITMMFRGREIVHADAAKKIFDRVSQEFSNIANIEQKPKMEGYRMTMVLAPKGGQ